MKMKKVLAMTLALIMILGLAACGGAAQEGFTVDKVTATYVSSPLNVPSILEKNEGSMAAMYKEMGLDFGYSDLTSGADQTAALASGDIQILNAVGGASVLLAAANGADIKVISMYSRAPGAFAMFSLDDSLTTPESLKGKSIAGPKGTNLHELLVAYLATAGMSISDVNYVSMDIPSALSAMEAGSVDVALLGGAAAYNAEKAGRHKICDGEGLIAATICTATSQDFYDKNPEIIHAFVDNQARILKYMEENHDEAVAITAKAIDTPVADVEAMLPLYNFSMEISQEDLDLFQATEAFLYDNGMIENHVNVRDLVLELKK